MQLKYFKLNILEYLCRISMGRESNKLGKFARDEYRLRQVKF